jgi:hypothetical protein
MADPKSDGLASELTAENPFAVSELCTGSQNSKVLEDPLRYQIEGDCLICGDTVRLPPVCPFTLQTDDLVPRTFQARYPTFRIVLIGRECQIHYSVSRRVAGYDTLLRIGCVTAMLLGILLILFVGPRSGPTFVAGIVLVFGAVILVNVRRLALTLHAYRPPGRYYIRGFSHEFLAECKRLSEQTPIA